jgi:hypothetical protein
VEDSVPRSIEPSLLAFQTGQNLLLPPLLDSLDPDRGEVNRHSVVEPGAEQRMHVRVSGAIRPAVLMDGEDTLGTTSGAPKVFSTASRRTRSERDPSSRWNRAAVGLSTVRIERKKTGLRVAEEHSAEPSQDVV